VPGLALSFLQAGKAVSELLEEECWKDETHQKLKREMLW
jgi:hypothetical protein